MIEPRHSRCETSEFGRFAENCERSSNSSIHACTIPCGKLAHGSGQSCMATSTTTRYLETSAVWVCSGIGCLGSGGTPCVAGVSNACPGNACSRWVTDGFRDRGCSILIPQSASPLLIHDKNGCANERPSGSLRGVPGNWYPYRDHTIRSVSEKCDVTTT